MNLKLTKKSGIILLLMVLVITFFSIMFLEVLEGDPDADPRYIREVRTESWSSLIGNSHGISSVQRKLEKMYGKNAPKVKVDLANNEYSEGNWHYEFSKLAEDSRMNGNFLATAGYYAIASFPHLYKDELAPQMYRKALNNFDLALEKGNYPYQKFGVKVDGKTVKAYLVLPQNYEDGEKIPAVVTTGGIDGLMIFGFTDYLKHWNNAGVAWVGFDMHGHGTSYGLQLTAENSDMLHYEVIKVLKSNPIVDPQNIFMYGRSLGGYAGLRLLITGKADELDVAGIAVAPIGEHILADWKLWYTIFTLEMDTRNCWGARLGVDPSDTKAVIEATKGMAVSDKSFWGDHETSIPLLVMNTAKDEMNPVREIKKMANLSKKGEYFIAFDEEGHCPSRPVALDQLSKFVEKNRR